MEFFLFLRLFSPLFEVVLPQWYGGGSRNIRAGDAVMVSRDSRHTIAQVPQWHGASPSIIFRKCRPYIVLALSRDKQVFKEKKQLHSN